MRSRVLATVADRVFTAFPKVFKKAHWVGNPLRVAFTQQPGPAERFAARTGPLHLLVVGVTDWSTWIASALSVVWLLVVIRWG